MTRDTSFSAFEDIFREIDPDGQETQGTTLRMNRRLFLKVSACPTRRW